MVATLVALAGALRVRALSTDFWLDEIWSLDVFARHATSVGEIFFGEGFKHDNNQPLNTVLLYLLGDRTGWIWYRIPAFVAGLTTVGVAVAIAARRGRADACITGLLVAVSFLMVVYSTEARGYAWLLLFSLLAYQALKEYLERPANGAAVAFAVWFALGLAAHTTITHFYLGALLWSGYRLRGRAWDLVRLHAVPVLCAVIWALTVVRGSVVGGGPSWTWSHVGDQALAWTLGYPAGVVPVALAALLVGGVVIWDAGRLWRDSSDEGLFTVGVIVGPPLLVAALNPPWLFPRYFLVSLLFLLLVAARCLARLWRQGRRGQIASGTVVLLLIIGNLFHIVPFSQYGRGGGSAVVRYIADHSTNRPALITGEPVDIWTEMPLTFYLRLAGIPDAATYVPRSKIGVSVPPTRIDWLVLQSQDEKLPVAAHIRLTSDAVFDLRARYPSYGPSGMNWLLYERVQPTR